MEEEIGFGTHPIVPPDARVLDLTGEVCPMTFVRARLALDRMAVGERILIVLRGEEATRGVPANAEALGHHVVTTTQGADGTVAVLLRKG